MKNILTVAGREFRSFFDQPTAYILLVTFLVVNFFFYFRTLFVTGFATLRPMFDLMPWLFLFVVPAACMRSLAEERSRGTIEMVLSQPVKEIEFLLGKFLGVLGFLTVGLVLTFGAFIALRAGGDPYGGVALAQYLGAFLLLCALVAIGLYASSLTGNQITAFIIGLAITFILIGITLPIVLMGLPPAVSATLSRLGILTHFSNIGRGVIDLRDVVYFVSVTVAFLALAYLSLLRERLNRHGSAYRTLWMGTVGILAICVTVNLFGRYIDGRWDLTPGKAYTLSPATRTTLRGLDDLVTIKFFASNQLPPQVALIEQDIDDLLSDIASAGGDNVVYERLSPEGETAARDEAEQLGIPAIQFNVLGQEEFQVKQGYLGIALQYADRLETLPFVQQTEDLEYRIAVALRNMMGGERPAVGFLTGHGEMSIEAELSAVAGGLRENYSIVAVDIAADSAAIPDSVEVLVIGAPTDTITPGEARKLEQFVDGGGNLFIAVQHAGIDPSQAFAAEESHPHLDVFLGGFGLAVGDGMLFDLRSNGRVTQPTASGMSVIVPYPLWPVMVPASAHAILEGVSTVLVPWASPIELTTADTVQVIPLLATSEYGGVMTGRFPIAPDFDWNQAAQDLRPRLGAIAMTPPEASEGAAPLGGRLVLIGDIEFATNRMLQAQPGERPVLPERDRLAGAGRRPHHHPGEGPRTASADL